MAAGAGAGAVIVLAGWWRHVLLAGFAAGLPAAAAVGAPAGWLLLAPAGIVALIGLGRGLGNGCGSRAAALAWLALLFGFAMLGGLGVGAARLAAIDGGAAQGRPGSAVAVEGFVAGAPRSWGGEVRAPLQTPRGRLMLVVPGQAGGASPRLTPGAALRAEGTLRPPEDWRADELRRLGIALELHAAGVQPLPGGRGGLSGYLDRVRSRAEEAVGAGMGESEAALARGFVLGQDDAIDARTRERFRRSGLAHLLAVSGQNVMLLAILAGALFALAGVPLRVRLLLIGGLIAIYVPVAGGGPSIQRAGVMAAAALVATLASRPADRLYALLAATVATLALNPLAAAEIGWQLSFVAVAGIMAAAAPLRDRLLAGTLGRLPERAGRPLAEGVALTLSATLATAPLLAHHFEAVSPASLPANLLVLPAVAPIMWLGMLAGLLGQVPAIPTEPLGAVAAILIRYVDAVAELLAAPGWASVGVSLSSPTAVALAYVVIAAAVLAAIAAHRRREALGTHRRRLVRALAASLALAVLAAALLTGGGGPPALAPGTLRIVQLDVGQGDAILVQPPRGEPLLVDTGPPGGGLVEALERHGVERLGAVFITHDQLDHAGGLAELAAAVPFERLLVGPSRPLRAGALAGSADAGLESIPAGGRVRAGALTIDVLWPPAAGGPPAADPNAEALVLAVRFGGYSALLAADAEQELTGLDPGPVDLLKVAHHGSADAGLAALLDRSAPRVALIGVGDNTYGHPTPETLEALEARGVCTLRTDIDGDVWADLGRGGISVGAQSAEPRDRPGCGAGG